MYTIEISKNTGDELEFVVGCEFYNEKLAKQVFHETSRIFAKKPTYDNKDYLVDLYDDQDLLETFVTDETGAKAIDEIYFKK
jgi:benzoyl-CoA reductase/2-hydroxyglutaryl-CoA dehydratase subunit BcrC/BadD/HgdB